ncbi:MAG TPA: hypothetical protein DIT13_17745 [Verrucomicrobiales bacterium]|nr:hypothetical protein [Verrucomicrobiales bacterium]HRJ09082.1 exo-alpha-sialidase [Prosthecobacter sp.]HRK14651.1 exo-alpha-sialidase [Prosthecobacter sp.]
MNHNFRILHLSLALLITAATQLGAANPRHWPLDQPRSDALTIHGHAESVAGVQEGALQLDGLSLIELKDSASLHAGGQGLSLTVWVNPFVLSGAQRMIVAKNRYSSSEREWGVMLDRDGKLRLYLWQDGWRTVTAKTTPRTGHWHQVGVVLAREKAELWVNGALEASTVLKSAIPATAAPVTLGGILDGTLKQTFFGALDDVQLFPRALTAQEMAAQYKPVTATLKVPAVPPVASAPKPAGFWSVQAALDAKADRVNLIFDGKSPDRLACDTTLRAMPDGSWVHVMLGGGDREPDPRNGVFLTRSLDQGETWSPMRRLDFGFPRSSDTAATVPSELMVLDGRCTMFFATHNGKFSGWKEWMIVSEDSCKTWGKPAPAPGRLHDRTFIRNHIVSRDGRILLPFQHYLSGPGPLNPRNGVLISKDGGKTWSEHGNIRLSSSDTYRGWAENNIVELADGRIAMIIRADRLGGVLYYAESNDGGLTWPDFAAKTSIPNPGSKATLYGLGGDSVALLHNPNPLGRYPLALWISFDGMKTWPYQRVLVKESSKGPRAALNYPDGFVSDDKRWLHFAFDDARYRAVRVSARLPEIPVLWDEKQTLPKSADLPVIQGARFSVIKPYEFQKDGYRFLHGLALCFHKGKLYASFGHNQGGENTDTEEARFCVSEDEGRTWSAVKTMDDGGPEVAVSHGVFLSHQGSLWAFMGAYTGTMQGIHTRAYRLNETSGEFEKLGVVVEGGFWPMQEPIRMGDGNWIMAGISAGGDAPAGGKHPAAVAISHGDNFLKWDLVRISQVPGLGKVWGESTVIVEGKHITNLSRYGAEAKALTSTSEDYGRTWTLMRPSNLPMATSKPYAGVLSTGQRYLVCSTSADGGGRRAPLTIAVSKLGETTFSKLFVIRRALFPEGPGESHERASLSYPYAIEYNGRLYVGYSNNGGNVGRIGEGRELWNNNSAELAVIPLDALAE